MTAGATPRAATARAAEALAKVGVDPRRAAELAAEAIEQARRERDPGARSTALRAAGLAAKAVGDVNSAVASLRMAVRVAARAGLAEPAAEARMSLAFALLDKGQVAGALVQANIAASTLRGLPAARLLSQRALILQRTGRIEEALAAYRRALPVLRRNGDAHWEARALNNRGILRAYRGELTAAEEDMKRCRELCLSLGQDRDAADSEWNLGFIAARRGDLPRALAHLDATEREHARFGVDSPDLLLDRADVLLSARLLTEAIATAKRGVAGLRAAGRESYLAEGLLLLAQAELEAAEQAAAQEHAREAAALFGEQGRTSWQRVASYIELRAMSALSAPNRDVVRAAQRAATAMAAAGWRALELDARLLAAIGSTALGDRESARSDLRSASRARRAGQIELRARAWYAEALLRRSSGDRAGALRAVAAGLRAVHGYRASLGATDLRVHGAAHGVDLSRLGLRLAAEGGDARRLLAWSERWRAGSLLLLPVRPPEDAELAAAMAEHRRVTAELDAAVLTQRPHSHLERLRAALEESIRRRTRLARGLYAPPPPPPSADELQQHLGELVLLSLLEIDGVLHAVTVDARRVQRHVLGEVAALTAEQDSLRFALRRVAHGHGTSRSLLQAHDAARLAATRIDAAIFGSVTRALGERPLVVVPTGTLQSLPWSLLPTCAERSVVIAPSAAVWLRAHDEAPTTAHAGACLIAGPRLTAATSEVTSIAKRYPRAVCLTGGAATTAAAMSALDGAAVAHIAAHGHMRSDNPLFSALEMYDGSLTVYDLETMSSAPRLVLLPACESGVASVVAGNEIIGLTAAFLALGTRTLIAAVLPLPDETTADFMTLLHDGLLAGRDPASALAGAQSQTDRDDPRAMVTSGAFVCFGAGA